jgi:DNA-directed RNA polymerase specialized sigma24 family protein
MSPGTDASHAQLAHVVRQHAGQLAASLVRVTGDFATAEDLVQDAVVAALQHWPVEGIPQRPDAWLFTVARRHGTSSHGSVSFLLAPSEVMYVPKVSNVSSARHRSILEEGVHDAETAA